MKKIILCALCLTSAPLFAVVPAGKPLIQRNANITLFVKDEESSIDQLIEHSQKIGGYLKNREKGHLVVRVPSEQLDSYLATVKGFGTLAENQIQSDERTEERAVAVTEIASREEMLNQYFAALKQTKSHGDLKTIQEETGTLVAELEQRKGQLRMMDYESKFSKVDIVFQKRNRQPIRLSGTSNFPWLRTVNVTALLQDFERGDL